MPDDLQPDVYKEIHKNKAKVCAIAAMEEPTADTIEEYMIPRFGTPARYDFPLCPKKKLMSLIHEYESLFQVPPGVTEAAYHHIPTTV